MGRTISDVQKRDEQTDRQTDKYKNSTFLASPTADEIRAPPNLVYGDRGPRARSCTLKTFRA